MRPKSPYLTHTRSSRRSVLKGAMVGTAGVAGVAGLAAAGIILTEPKGDKTAAHAAAAAAPDAVKTILNIAATAETLAVIFYTQGLENAKWLYLSNPAFLDLEAARLEEMQHLQFLLKQGAKPLTKTFSFPKGADTFKNLGKFIQTQQLLETLFVAAYIVAAKEFALLQKPDLVQIAGQIGAVEAEHRAIGRAIGGLRPANNEAFAPVHLKKVSDAPTVLKNSGFLTPKKGNSFSFWTPYMNNSGVIDLTPQS